MSRKFVSTLSAIALAVSSVALGGVVVNNATPAKAFDKASCKADTSATHITKYENFYFGSGGDRAVESRPATAPFINQHGVDTSSMVVVEPIGSENDQHEQQWQVTFNQAPTWYTGRWREYFGDPRFTLVLSRDLQIVGNITIKMEGDQNGTPMNATASFAPMAAPERILNNTLEERKAFVWNGQRTRNSLQGIAYDNNPGPSDNYDAYWYNLLKSTSNYDYMYPNTRTNPGHWSTDRPLDAGYSYQADAGYYLFYHAKGLYWKKQTQPKFIYTFTTKRDPNFYTSAPKVPEDGQYVAPGAVHKTYVDGHFSYFGAAGNVWDYSHVVYFVHDNTEYNKDSDGDGIKDVDEAKLGTDPCNPDTDGDGKTDGAEVSRSLSNLPDMRKPDRPRGEGTDPLVPTPKMSDVKYDPATKTITGKTQPNRYVKLTSDKGDEATTISDKDGNFTLKFGEFVPMDGDWPKVGDVQADGGYKYTSEKRDVAELKDLKNLGLSIWSKGLKAPAYNETAANETLYPLYGADEWAWEALPSQPSVEILPDNAKANPKDTGLKITVPASGEVDRDGGKVYGNTTMVVKGYGKVLNYTSTDGGKTWTPKDGAPALKSVGDGVFELTFDNALSGIWNGHPVEVSLVNAKVNAAADASNPFRKTSAPTRNITSLDAQSQVPTEVTTGSIPTGGNPVDGVPAGNSYVKGKCHAGDTITIVGDGKTQTVPCKTDGTFVADLGKDIPGDTPLTITAKQDGLDASSPVNPNPKVATDKSKLAEQINTSEGAQPAFAPAKTPAEDAYNKALEDAKKVNGDATASQKQIDEATAALKAAQDELATSFSPDKSTITVKKVEGGAATGGDVTEAQTQDKVQITYTPKNHKGEAFDAAGAPEKLQVRVPGVGSAEGNLVDLKWDPNTKTYVGEATLDTASNGKQITVEPVPAVGGANLVGVDKTPGHNLNVTQPTPKALNVVAEKDANGKTTAVNISNIDPQTTELKLAIADPATNVKLVKDPATGKWKIDGDAQGFTLANDGSEPLKINVPQDKNLNGKTLTVTPANATGDGPAATVPLKTVTDAEGAPELVKPSPKVPISSLTNPTPADIQAVNEAMKAQNQGTYPTFNVVAAPDGTQQVVATYADGSTKKLPLSDVAIEKATAPTDIAVKAIPSPANPDNGKQTVTGKCATGTLVHVTWEGMPAVNQPVATCENGKFSVEIGPNAPGGKDLKVFATEDGKAQSNDGTPAVTVPTDKSELTKALNGKPAKQAGTTDAQREYNTALDNANAIKAKPDATQKVIDQATKDLNDAYQKLQDEQNAAFDAAQSVVLITKDGNQVHSASTTDTLKVTFTPKRHDGKPYTKDLPASITVYVPGVGDVTLNKGDGGVYSADNVKPNKATTDSDNKVTIADQTPFTGMNKLPEYRLDVTATPPLATPTLTLKPIAGTVDADGNLTDGKMTADITCQKGSKVSVTMPDDSQGGAATELLNPQPYTCPDTGKIENVTLNGGTTSTETNTIGNGKTLTITTTPQGAQVGQFVPSSNTAVAKVNKENLQKAIDAAKPFDPANTAAKQAFNDALKKAQEINAKDNTWQKEVDETLKALADAEKAVKAAFDPNQSTLTATHEDGSAIDKDHPLVKGQKVTITFTPKNGEGNAFDPTSGGTQSAPVIKVKVPGVGSAEGTEQTLTWDSTKNAYVGTFTTDNPSTDKQISVVEPGAGSPLAGAGETAEIPLNVKDKVTAPSNIESKATAGDPGTQTVTGSCETGSTVHVYDADGKELGNAVCEDGAFKVEIGPNAPGGKDLKVNATKDGKANSDDVTKGKDGNQLKVATDKSKLNDNINGKQPVANATDKAQIDYNDALKKAQDVAANPKATQKEIDDANKALTDAKKKLDDYNATYNQSNSTLTVDVTDGVTGAKTSNQDKAKVGDKVKITFTPKSNDGKNYTGSDAPATIQVNVPGVDGPVTLTKQSDGSYTGEATIAKKGTGSIEPTTPGDTGVFKGKFPTKAFEATQDPTRKIGTDASGQPTNPAATLTMTQTKPSGANPSGVSVSGDGAIPGATVYLRDKAGDFINADGTTTPAAQGPGANALKTTADSQGKFSFPAVPVDAAKNDASYKVSQQDTKNHLGISDPVNVDGTVDKLAPEKPRIDPTPGDKDAVVIVRPGDGKPFQVGDVIVVKDKDGTIIGTTTVTDENVGNSANGLTVRVSPALSYTADAQGNPTNYITSTVEDKFGNVSEQEKVNIAKETTIYTHEATNVSAESVVDKAAGDDVRHIFITGDSTASDGSEVTLTFPDPDNPQQTKTVKGTVQDGHFKIDIGPDIPDLTKVNVVVKDPNKLASHGEASTTVHVDRKLLQTELDHSKAVDPAVTKADNDYNKAIEEAGKVLKDPNATQRQVDEATAKLKAAKEAYEKQTYPASGVHAASTAGKNVVVTGKAPKSADGSKVFVTFPDPANPFVTKTVEGTVKDGKFSVDTGTNEIPVGTEVTVTVQDAGKNVSEPVKATVAVDSAALKKFVGDPANGEIAKPADRELTSAEKAYNEALENAKSVLDRAENPGAVAGGASQKEIDDALAALTKAKDAVVNQTLPATDAVAASKAGANVVVTGNAPGAEDGSVVTVTYPDPANPGKTKTAKGKVKDGKFSVDTGDNTIPNGTELTVTVTRPGKYESDPIKVTVAVDSSKLAAAVKENQPKNPAKNSAEEAYNKALAAAKAVLAELADPNAKQPSQAEIDKTLADLLAAKDAMNRPLPDTGIDATGAFVGAGAALLLIAAGGVLLVGRRRRD